MQIPRKMVAAILMLIVLVLITVYIFFIRRKTELFESNGKCKTEQDEINGKCYEKCREGFSSINENCYEVCKPGEKSDGMKCISSDGTVRYVNSYSRQEIVLTPSVEASVPMSKTECSENYEAVGTFCVEKCNEGFTKNSLYCMRNCPDDMQDMGLICANETKTIIKESYIPKTMFSSNTSNTSNVMACIEGYKNVDAICVQECSPDHVLTGALCIEKCKSTETDLGSMCLLDHVTRKKDIVIPGITEVPIKT